MQLSAHLFYFYFWERAKRNQVFQRAVKHVCNWIIMKLRVNKNKILPHDSKICLLNIFTKQSNMWVVRRFALINRFMQQSQARFHQNLSWLRVVDIKFTSKLQVFYNNNHRLKNGDNSELNSYNWVAGWHFPQHHIIFGTNP